MIANQTPWPEPTVTNGSVAPPAKPPHSGLPRQAVAPSQITGPYGGKAPQG